MVQTNCLKDNKIIIICGPTASSKTALAIKCAKLLNSEVISADSMCVYKGLNIGTAKPNQDEREQATHHLIDVVSPNENFTVSDYKNLAKPIIDNLIKNGKVPVVCGGTGFYINSILYNFSYGNGEGDLEFREKYNSLAKEYGNEYVYNILKEVDIETANKLHFNDVKRVIRALEIAKNGIKKSEIVDDKTPLYNYNAFMFNFPRETLNQRINTRVDYMIDNGLVDEVENLVKNGIDIKNQCMQGIGYKEIYSYLMGEISLFDAIEKIKLNTRHYAKRQITFFKRMPNLNVIDFGDIDEIAKRIVDNI